MFRALKGRAAARLADDEGAILDVEEALSLVPPLKETDIPSKYEVAIRHLGARASQASGDL